MMHSSNEPAGGNTAGMAGLISFRLGIVLLCKSRPNLVPLLLLRRLTFIECHARDVPVQNVICRQSLEFPNGAVQAALDVSEFKPRPNDKSLCRRVRVGRKQQPKCLSNLFNLFNQS